MDIFCKALKDCGFDHQFEPLVSVLMDVDLNPLPKGWLTWKATSGLRRRPARKEDKSLEYGLTRFNMPSQEAQVLYFVGSMEGSGKVLCRQSQ